MISSLSQFPTRRGSMLLEAMVALVLLSAAFIIVGQMHGFVLAQDQVAAHRQLAVDEAANQLERVSALPWQDLTSEKLNSFTLHEETTRSLQHARLEFKVTDLASPRGKQVQVTVSWQEGNGSQAVHLTAWRYGEGGSP